MEGERGSGSGLREVWERIEGGGDSGPNGQDSSSAYEGRYENLSAAGLGLRRYGVFLKGVGVVIILIGLACGMYLGMAASGASLALGVMTAFVGVAAGAGLHALGTFIAAAGEGLFAMRDMAVNTARTVAALQTRASKRGGK